MFYVRMKNKKRVIVLIFYISRVIIKKQCFLYICIWNIKNMQKVLICRTIWSKNLSSFKIGTSEK